MVNLQSYISDSGSFKKGITVGHMGRCVAHQRAALIEALRPDFRLKISLFVLRLEVFWL